MTTRSTNPFALTDCERKFTSEDWAWQFLRLNAEYRKEFSDARDNAPIPRRLSPSLRRSLSDPDSASLARNPAREFGNRFGLAALLDPAHEALPALNDGGSWFFPSVRPAHAYFLDERDRNAAWQPLDNNSFPDQSSIPFGYVMPTLNDEIKLENPGPHRPWFLSVPVDCSVSPNGQLMALSMLARSLRASLVSLGRITARNRARPTTWRVTDMANSEALSHISPTTNPPSGLMAPAPLPRWKAVTIDVLSPVGRQILACQQELLAVYQQYQRSVDDRLWPLRFPSTLRHCPIDGYSYLKSLLSLARHRATPTFNGDSSLADEIAIEVGINPKPSRYIPWLDDFLSATQLHVRRAHALVSGDHPLLVHGQIIAG